MVNPMDDKALRDLYADAAHQDPAGPARGRQGKRLSSHVPVRFSPEMITAVKRLADQDGTSVSTWIRNVVEREVHRRLPPATALANAGLVFTPLSPASTWTQPSTPSAENVPA